MNNLFAEYSARDSSISHFFKASEVKRINENGKIRDVEFNSEGTIISYLAGDNLKLFSSWNLGLRNIISVSIDKYKFLQEHTLVHSTENNMYYLSTYDNKYLRQFNGHENPINSISVNSTADTVMSVCNKMILMWDIRMQSPIKSLSSFHSLAALSTGLNYTVATNSFIRIFDIRNDKEPVIYKTIPSSFYKKISYSPDNNFIILKTETSYTFLDNSGETTNFITLESQNDGDLTPDSKYLFCPSKLYTFAYRISDRKKVDSIDTKCEGSKIVRINPCGNQFVVAGERSLQAFNF